MSAFMVSEDCLKVLAVVATTRFNGGGDLEAANEAAKELYESNAQSVAFRYREAVDISNPPKVTPGDAMRLQKYMRNPVVVLKAAEKYDYQACEYPDYPESKGKRYLEAAKYNATVKLPGWEDAPSL